MKFFSALVVFGCLLSVRPAACTSVIPSEKEYVISLDGQWHFRLEQDGDRPEHGRVSGPPEKIVLPAKRIPFQEPGYREDASWKSITVPGNWEMEGFSPATYNQPDNAIGLYRLRFRVPEEWAGRVVKLNFDGVQNGAEVYVNGKPVNVDEPSWGKRNDHEGGFDAFQADVTPAVKFGADNLLAVRVYKNTKSVDLDTGDYFFLGGIHRSVTLFSVPKSHLDDITVITTVTSPERAGVHVRLCVEGPAKGVSATFLLEGQPPIHKSVDADGKVDFALELERPRLWSAEHPELYGMDISLEDAAGHVTERVSRKVGVREVSIRNGILLLNGVPVKLSGICRHDIYPTLGSALNREIWRKDILMMKAANINAIRTSHYPYGSGFYDLCDELGMYVVDEMAACWCPTDKPELYPAFAQHARELVRRDKNHPSVIIWAVGNENRKGDANRVAADEIRKIDTTRPRAVSWRNGDLYGVELDDAHYTRVSDIAFANEEPRRAARPKIYLENPNDWEIRNGADYGTTDRWAAVIDHVWSEVWDDDHIPGTFLWEWQDRAVADKCPLKLYDFDTTTGINYVKAKGICDGFRNPRPWYYHVKMAYAPVRLNLVPRKTEGGIDLSVENRYSFTDLHALDTKWTLLNGAKELASKTIHPVMAPRTRGKIHLAVDPSLLDQADAVRVGFDHPGGVNIATYLVHLKPERDDSPRLDNGEGTGVYFPAFNLVTVNYRNDTIGWRRAVRHRASLTHITIERPDGPLKPELLANEKALTRIPLDRIRTVSADILLPDESTTTPVGHLRVNSLDGHFSYKVSWFGKKADVQELGWTFPVPREDDHFSWHRKPYWSWYPEMHIGREKGTATPDSMNADITKITRPDAFDFNSTKYDCDWATLADETGKGVGVIFDPDQRQHCRAGVAADGRYELTVNRLCTVPADLSTNIVPGDTFTFHKGGEESARFTVGACTGR